MERLSFYDWAEIVCGRYRIADKTVLQDLWEKDWLPQQAIEHLQRTKQFHKRYRHLVPFWDAWKGPAVEIQRRRRALHIETVKARIARAIMKEIANVRFHRLEPKDLAFVNRLFEQCRANVAAYEALRKRGKKG